MTWTSLGRPRSRAENLIPDGEGRTGKEIPHDTSHVNPGPPGTQTRRSYRLSCTRTGRVRRTSGGRSGVRTRDWSEDGNGNRPEPKGSVTVETRKRASRVHSGELLSFLLGSLSTWSLEGPPPRRVGRGRPESLSQTSGGRGPGPRTFSLGRSRPFPARDL